jgi:hypothetical protein
VLDPSAARHPPEDGAFSWVGELLFGPVDEMLVYVQSRNSRGEGIDKGCLAQAKLSVCYLPM